MTSIKSFINRLKKIGIEVELFGNYPWIYLDSVNGVRITDKLESEHKFTVFFLSVRPGGKERITDIPTIFKVIRKALCQKQQENILS